MSPSDGGPLPSAPPIMVSPAIIMTVVLVVTFLAGLIIAWKPQYRAVLLLIASCCWLPSAYILYLIFTITNDGTYIIEIIVSTIALLLLVLNTIRITPQQPQLPNTKPL
jgi:hypothetical protein